MSTASISSQITKKLYSLSKAAEILGLQPDDLLTYGAEGKVEISIYKPTGFAVWIEERTPKGYKLPTVKSTCYNLKPYPAFMHGQIDLLNLDQSDCDRILNADGFRQHNFTSGYIFEKNNELVRVDPLSVLPMKVIKINPSKPPSSKAFVTLTIEDKSADIKKTDPVFTLRSGNDAFNALDSNCESIELSLEKLYIGSNQLNTFLENMTEPPADSFKPEPHHSDMLVYLNQVAREMWSLAKTNNGLYPAPYDVQEALGKKSGFSSDNLRRYGAITIRPNWADDQNSSGTLLTKGDNYRTKYFDALVAASDHHWRAPFDDKNLYKPKNLVVESWLKAEPHKLQGAHAKAAATIIRIRSPEE